MPRTERGLGQPNWSAGADARDMVAISLNPEISNGRSHRPTRDERFRESSISRCVKPYPGRVREGCRVDVVGAMKSPRRLKPLATARFLSCSAGCRKHLVPIVRHLKW